MSSFDGSALWKRTLGSQPEDRDAARAVRRLEAAFIEFHKKATQVAAEISNTYSQLTVHDATHLDALWEMADIIAPNVPVNPAEAFVLGGAFLVHDLANGLAAYANGDSELQQDSRWQDIVWELLAKTTGRTPRKEDLDAPPPDIRQQAREEMLRNLHAQKAEQLTQKPWKHNSGGDEFFLISDPELRGMVAEPIGRLAHSHWWDVSALKSQFPHSIGAIDFVPKDWGVDQLKLACLMRACDAIHVDARRAPLFLRVLRQTKGLSDEHWKFQSKILKPQVRGGRLVVSSASSFGQSDVAAWWLCLDTMRMVDGELRKIDALLSDTNRARLLADGVSGVEDVERFAEHVRPDGWVPVDVRVQVSDVPRLVQRLGGEQLYGNDSTIPLRELVQNAADAVRARRTLEKKEENWGGITVTSGRDGNLDWIEVADTGLGMSKAVLKGPLLDFGVSYWGSRLAREENPGLLSSGFQSTGKFGIGFFSVFMWGEKVRVTTRRTDASREDTYVLEFSTGPSSRPILRKALPSERMRDGGTSVRVWISKRLTEQDDVAIQQSKVDRLGDICRQVFPALDVDLFVETGGIAKKCIVRANDWKTLPVNEFLSRFSNVKLLAASNMREIVDEQRILGRAFINPRNTSAGRWRRNLNVGVVTVGGQVGARLHGVAGVLIGDTTIASRMDAIPIANGKCVAAWASEQARLLKKTVKSQEVLAECAALVRFLGGDTGPLPIARIKGEWITVADLRKWRAPDRVLLLHDAGESILMNKYPKLKLNDNVVAIGMGHPGVLDSIRPERRWHLFDWPSLGPAPFPEDWSFERQSLEGIAVEVLARMWKCSVVELARSSLRSGDKIKYSREVGRVGRKRIFYTVQILRKPGSPSAQEKEPFDVLKDEFDDDDSEDFA